MSETQHEVEETKRPEEPPEAEGPGDEVETAEADGAGGAEASEAAPEDAAATDATDADATDATDATATAATDGEEVDDPDGEEVDDPDAGDDGGPGPSQARPTSVSREHLKSILESLIFVADKPVQPRQLARSTRSKKAEVVPLVEELMGEYKGRGLELVEVAGGYQFRSAAVNAPFVRDFVAQRPVRLTRAQLEALAIIAYRQPVTRPELEEIRGVDSGSALKVLLDRALVKIIGRKEEPGRPLLYGTTPAFLELFGMSSLKDLPTLREFSELSEESRALFERRMGEPIDLSEVEEITARLSAEGEEEDFDLDDEAAWAARGEAAEAAEAAAAAEDAGARAEGAPGGEGAEGRADDAGEAQAALDDRADDDEDDDDDEDGDDEDDDDDDDDEDGDDEDDDDEPEDGDDEDDEDDDDDDEPEDDEE